jgi:hypothetical protein
MCDVLLGYKISRDRPPFCVTAQNELRLYFPLLLQPSALVRPAQIVLSIVIDYFQQALIRSTDVFEFDIQYGIDPMLMRQKPEAILPSPAGEQRAFTARRLAVEIQFAGPPGLDTIFELGGSCRKPVTVARLAGHILGSNLQAPGFLHLMLVGNEKRGFSGAASRIHKQDSQKYLATNLHLCKRLQDF